MFNEEQTESIIQTIQQRLAYGMNQEDIISDLEKNISPEILFLCLHAAAILDRDSEKD
jgi:hypothetical protein